MKGTLDSHIKPSSSLSADDTVTYMISGEENTIEFSPLLTIILTLPILTLLASGFHSSPAFSGSHPVCYLIPSYSRLPSYLIPPNSVLNMIY